MKKSMGSWIKKLAGRAGIVLWEKPFQNMRATCATELRDIHPGHVCEAWLGHTKEIADRHYRQVMESNFEKAAGIMRTENRAVDVNPLKSKQSQEKNCAGSCAVHAGNGLQINEAINKKSVNCGVLQSTANVCAAQNDPNEVPQCRLVRPRSHG
jgi:hypothetical protein